MQFRSVVFQRSMLKTATIIAVLCLAVSAHGQNPQVLLQFTGSNGNAPYTGLIQDSHGYFYGATNAGGANNTGLVYKLTKLPSGEWQQIVLYQFSVNGGENSDGANPQMPRLTMDSHGFLYGTTIAGGAYGCGTVFRLAPLGPLHWAETTLHSFANSPSDGCQPFGGVAVDAAGNVYGTADTGGNPNCEDGCGIIYKLIPTGVNGYFYNILHFFQGIPSNGQCGVIYDGQYPGRMTPVLDSAGNIYGTTASGGVGCAGFGAEWELSPNGQGGYSYSIINAPGSPTGAYPMAGIVLDSVGNLYGTTVGNTIFELVKANGYQQQILFEMTGSDNGGDYDTVTFDSAGNLYWTTNYATTGIYGTVEELSNGVHSILYEFPSSPAIYGEDPWAPVWIDSSGNIYGTNTIGGGSNGNGQGTVWEITP